MDQRPNPQEIQFLNKSYNFFLDIYDEIKNENFWNQTSYYRFAKAKDAFLVYSELLEYEPIQWFINALKDFRPPMEAELSKEFCLFIRNILIHFPFFNSWDEVAFSKHLINWSKPGRTIDKFLTKYSGRKEIKYRVWNSNHKSMTYISIKFPLVYDEKTEILLKDIISEKEGLIFTFSLMHRVLLSQIESYKVGQ